MRKDLFDILQKFSDLHISKLSGEEKRYVERTLIEGKQDGNSLLKKNFIILNSHANHTFG